MPLPPPVRRLALPIALLVALVRCAGAAPAAARGAEAEVRAVLAAQEAAWNRGDLEGFMAGYWRSDSLTFYSGGDVSHGWQMAHDRYQRRYQGEGREMGRLVVDLHEVGVLSRDAAIVKGTWRLQLKDSAPEGLFTLVLRRIPGQGWRIVHDHTSVAAPK